MPEKKLKFKKNDFILLGVLLVAALAVAAFYFIGSNNDHPIAVISVDGKNIMKVDLAKAEDKTFSLDKKSGLPVSFEIRDHKIRFVDVNCPDHVCENVGFISRSGESAVCLPNKTALVIR
ncbi:hypothetical protein EDD70_2110 [Hydrogenoanaerobacterium saccharovorans]|uniref:Uncharacterized protein n=1 Tax=Hydrogenoanaerobacterium saccharovorans TaxID=474960 RepID=A0A1H8CM08_9FIRM|nr:NusG domain II-containing protein [Hydrogenoanaerobacterium saccharovorans]RPF43150.1 hypothetical protein EDD70_2110 [Hydrogenoanaerobacterium saccharovorans]SEM95107.1 hypothetical protein SAMN05216180_2168 [Hydrogenoanaerobacterium saccharovorans]